MEFKTLLYSENNGVGVLKINRPQALNALNRELISELGVFFEWSKQNSTINPTLRCLILIGNSEKAFVAGADLKEMVDLSPVQAHEFARLGQKVFMQIEAHSVPVIAAVNGFALGGGLELALACDFIVCSNRARFGLPEVSLGLLPGFGGTQRLAQAVGNRRAREMTYTGKHYDALAAQEMGLVNRVVEPEMLLECAMELANHIVKRAPLAVSKAKKSILQGYDLPLAQGMELEADLFAQLFQTTDSKEGIQAFLQKRDPQFTGK